MLSLTLRPCTRLYYGSGAADANDYSIPKSLHISLFGPDKTPEKKDENIKKKSTV